MRKRISRWFSLLVAVFTIAATGLTADAALLDVGPTVPQVLNSSVPTLGHGFPLWYRDTNRLPLELCMDQAMCFFAPPNPAATVSFPGNMPDEAFWWAAESIITLPGTNQRAILVQALEAAFSTGDAVPGAQISFGRVRIRIDTPVAGEYLVTTPYKQYTFTIANDPDSIADGVNFTEDIGIAEGGVFTGALAAPFGPFLYCNNAPIVTATGSYLGDGVPCPVLGSPFTDPLTGQPANLFRIQGPPGSNLGGLGNNTVESNLFSVNGKIYTGTLSTPLTVDRVTYTLDNAGMQVNAFATTQPISNQTVGGLAFPGRFALTLAPSTLILSGTGIPTQPLMTTNNAADGKFFSTSGVVAAPDPLPATVLVTNNADTPPTAQEVPLVDEVVIIEASFAPTTTGGTLKVVALSGDKLALPALTVSMKDGPRDVLLGTIPGGSGVLTVTFPLTITLPAPIGTKTYNIPPESVTVTSAKSGSDTDPVSNPLLQASVAPVATNDTATVAAGGSVTINLVLNDTTSAIGTSLDLASVEIAALPLPTKGTVTNNGNGTITYSLTAAPAAGSDTVAYTIKDTAGSVSNVATVTVTILPPVVPVAANDTATVAAGGSVTINLVLNDTTSATGNPLDLASVAIAALPLPAKGTVTNNGNGTITYSQTVAPAAGSDTVAYTVKDTAGSVSNVATVIVTISNPPVANADTFTTNEDTPAILNVIANDADPDAPLNTIAPATVLVTLQPAHGTAVALGNGTVRYTPNLNYNNTALTPDTFTYTVSDTLGSVSFPATVSITVTPVADLPLAQNDSATTLMNTAVAINTLTNDSQADGLAIVPATLSIVNNPLHGTATVIVDPQNINNRLISYVPATNFFGTDSFTYLVRDNSAVPTASAPATVSVTVIQVNIPPVAGNDVANTTIGIARTINLVANDTDADGATNPASVVIVTQPANGTLSVPTATGTVTYTPTAAGTDTFTYNVKDLAGAVSNNAQVTVSVASPITDSVNVLRAQFETATRRWNIEGNTVNLSTPLRTLIIRVGNDNAGQVIGTVDVKADGRWQFQLGANPGNIGPDATRTISVSLPSGASRLAYPVAVK